jgi:hypothetical protein
MSFLCSRWANRSRRPPHPDPRDRSRVQLGCVDNLRKREDRFMLDEAQEGHGQLVVASRDATTAFDPKVNRWRLFTSLGNTRASTGSDTRTSKSNRAAWQPKPCWGCSAEATGINQGLIPSSTGFSVMWRRTSGRPSNGKRRWRWLCRPCRSCNEYHITERNP